ncbi:MAG: hypothetical protein NZ954_04720 [Thermofilaceae archaeon]|nr:hypothetical protein [Thermofilaceae archaeon]
MSLRASTVYSRFSVNVKEARREGGKLLEATKGAALSIKPVDAEFRFEKPPSLQLTFDGLVAPVGLSGRLESLNLYTNPVIPKRVDQVVEDLDIKAGDAIWELYSLGLDNYYITRLLSLGMLGKRNSRKIVPTRWAITAVDKLLGDRQLRKVKHASEIQQLQVHYVEYIGNRYILILAPGSWAFEVIEIWLPGSVWVNAAEPYLTVNYELWEGKARYPEAGGGYYAIRLPVLEYLSRIGRCATVVAIREVTPRYYAPVGFWQIRESVRSALSSNPVYLVNAKELVTWIRERIEVSVETVINASNVLEQLLKPGVKLL